MVVLTLAWPGKSWTVQRMPRWGGAFMDSPEANPGGGEERRAAASNVGAGFRQVGG
jgi:hypothetical protein